MAEWSSSTTTLPTTLEGGAMMTMRTAQATVLVGLTLGIARSAHGLGRSAVQRAWLRRLVLHRAVPSAAIGLGGAGVAFFLLLPRPQDLPRRYADYLPDDGTVAGADQLPGAALATLLVGGSIVLLTVWVWLRFARQSGRYTPLLRQGVPGVGGLLLLAAFVGDWIADRISPPSFGWYLYAPLGDASLVPSNLTGDGRALHGIAATLAALGLGVLTAVAAFRAGRKETTGTTTSPGERR